MLGVSMECWVCCFVDAEIMAVLVSACFLVSREEVVRLAMQLISRLFEGDPRFAMKIFV